MKNGPDLPSKKKIYVIKKSGEKAPYDIDRISRSIFKAANFIGGNDKKRANEIATKVDSQIQKLSNIPLPKIHVCSKMQRTALPDSMIYKELLCPIPA